MSSFNICAVHGEIFPSCNGSKFCVASVYNEYAKTFSNPRVEFKANVTYLLKNFYYVIQLNFPVDYIEKI